MAIKKIISGGQTGADQAALDAAIKLGIPHGGWIPKGRKTEDGPLPEKYELQEMPTGNYPKRTAQNVIDSDGTVIISHGKLAEGSKYTEEMVDRHNKPCLHIDLNETPAFQAISDIHSWIFDNNIEILNVAGPRESKDFKIYDHTKFLITGVVMLGLEDAESGSYITDYRNEEYLEQLPVPPGTVNEAVDLLISELPLIDRGAIANMDIEELDRLHFPLEAYIRNQYKLWSGNDVLVKSCRNITGNQNLHVDNAPTVIVHHLWKRLRDTHQLRVVK